MAYSCYDRPPIKNTALVQRGWIYTNGGMSREPVMEEVPDGMTKTCQYTHDRLGRIDPGCEGCRHKYTGEKNG